MASPTIKRGKRHSSGKSISVGGMSLLPRRCTAWMMEVYLVAMSGLVPYSIGAYIESHSRTQQVPLHPVLAKVEEEITQTLALPQAQTPRQVPPLTNIFWGLALAMPIAVTGWQLYILSRTGRTLPKRWLGIRVIASNGRSPSGLQILLREGVGKWGLPLSIAYLLWRYSPLFPNGGLLLGLSGVMILVEGGVLLFSPRRRSFHDQIADTVVIDTKYNFKKGVGQNRKPRSSPTPPAVTVEIPLDIPSYSRKSRQNRSPEPVRAIVLSSQEVEQDSNLWLWMRQHPGTTLLVVALAGMTLILATFVGTQVYIQSKTDQRQSLQQQNEEFKFLVTQLAGTSADPLEERKSLILALARVEDPRALSLLVDLLGQETNLSVINTLQQAFASVGTKALPALRQLNQSLSQQLQSLDNQNSRDYELTAWRLRATKQAIAQIFVLHHGHLNDVNLNRVDLSKEILEIAQFSLVAEQLDLSGINLENALLNQARLKETIFKNDQLISNLKGANLTQADLTEAFLSQVSLEKANLSQASLKGANLSQANLKDANLSSALLIQTNLQQASLQSASLTGADLTQAQLQDANLENANLGQIKASGANFSQANLTQSNWQDSDLSRANFQTANLQKADFSSTFLQGANLRNAQLENANLAEANLSDADLRGANLAGANFLNVTFFTPKSSRRDTFLKTSIKDESGSIVEGVDFSQVKNLNSHQIEFICQKGGIHSQCIEGDRK